MTAVLRRPLPHLAPPDRITHLTDHLPFLGLLLNDFLLRVEVLVEIILPGVVLIVVSFFQLNHMHLLLDLVTNHVMTPVALFEVGLAGLMTARVRVLEYAVQVGSLEKSGLAEDVLLQHDALLFLVDLAPRRANILLRLNRGEWVLRPFRLSIEIQGRYRPVALVLLLQGRACQATNFHRSQFVREVDGVCQQSARYDRFQDFFRPLLLHLSSQVFSGRSPILAQGALIFNNFGLRHERLLRLFALSRLYLLLCMPGQIREIHRYVFIRRMADRVSPLQT